MRKLTGPASAPTIIAQAPCRADMAGGTMDLWPLYLFHPGALTLNFAINILTTCRITPLKRKRIYLRSLDTRREEHSPASTRCEGVIAFDCRWPPACSSSSRPKKDFSSRPILNRPPGQVFLVLPH